MPGHIVSRPKDSALFDKYQCSYCNHLMKNAVQPICGHHLCQCCADELFAERLPKCPKVDCQEYLKSEEAECFPDRFVRKEIEKMIVGCPHQRNGCQWEDSLASLEAHLKACDFPVLEEKCPFAVFGCPHTRTMSREEVRQHLIDFLLEHFKIVSQKLRHLIRSPDPYPICMCDVEEKPHKEISPQQATSPMDQLKIGHGECDRPGDSFPIGGLPDDGKLKDLGQKIGASKSQNQLETIVLEKKKEKSCVEKSLDKTKPSPLIEMSMHNDWKITQFSQKRTDAQLGKCPSMFSHYFYTEPYYGYKMCLKLLILGEGIGMLVFFVIMKGDCDDLLQWPFTSKVTFKLINQTGGRNIIKNFQPDPDLESASLQKPEEDMNIASGCPLFVRHNELDTDGFIVDDTIRINCCVSPP